MANILSYGLKNILNMKIDLGCGCRKKEGFVGIDIIDFSNLYKKDEFVQMDLNKRINLPDNSVDEIYTNHYLEHHPNLTFLIDEIYRVCKNGAVITIKCPHFTNNKHPFHYGTWDYYSLQQFENDDKKAYYKRYFKTIKRELRFGGFYKLFFWLKYIPYIYENTFLRSIIFCNEILIILKVVKRLK